MANGHSQKFCVVKSIYNYNFTRPIENTAKCSNQSYSSSHSDECHYESTTTLQSNASISWINELHSVIKE